MARGSSCSSLGLRGSSWSWTVSGSGSLCPLEGERGKGRGKEREGEEDELIMQVQNGICSCASTNH